MIDAHNPNDPDAPVIRAFRSNLPEGYVELSVGQEPQDVPPESGGTATTADPKAATGNESKEN